MNGFCKGFRGVWPKNNDFGFSGDLDPEFFKGCVLCNSRWYILYRGYNGKTSYLSLMTFPENWKKICTFTFLSKVLLTMHRSLACYISFSSEVIIYAAF